MASDESESLSRRELMLALSATASGLPRWIHDLLVAATTRPAVASPPPVSRRLSTMERAILRVFCDRILPRTETPGALDAKVPEFIEYLVAEGTEKSTQHFHDTLAVLDTGCVATCKVGMVRADVAEVDRFLQTIEDRLAAYTDGLRIAGRADRANFIVPWLKLERAPAEERNRVECYVGLKWLAITAYATSEVGGQALHVVHSPFHAGYEGCKHPEHGGG